MMRDCGARLWGALPCYPIGRPPPGNWIYKCRFFRLLQEGGVFDFSDDGVGGSSSDSGDDAGAFRLRSTTPPSMSRGLASRARPLAIDGPPRPVGRGLMAGAELSSGSGSGSGDGGGGGGKGGPRRKATKGKNTKGKAAKAAAPEAKRVFGVVAVADSGAGDGDDNDAHLGRATPMSDLSGAAIQPPARRQPGRPKRKTKVVAF